MLTQDLLLASQPQFPGFSPGTTLLDILKELARAIGRQTKKTATRIWTAIHQTCRDAAKRLAEADQAESDTQERDYARYQGFYIRDFI